MAYVITSSSDAPGNPHTHTVTLTTLEARVTALEAAIALKAAQADLVTTTTTADAAAAAVIVADAKRVRDIKAVSKRTTAIVNKHLINKGGIQ